MGLPFLTFFFLFGLCAADLFSEISKLKANIISIKKCPLKEGDTELKFDVNLIQDGEEKYVNMALDSEFAIDGEFSYTLTIDKKDGAKYTQFMTLDGELCAALDAYFKTPWENLKTIIKPSLPSSDCEVPPGKYTAEHFQMKGDDYNVPPGTMGEYKAVYRGYKSDGSEVSCYLIELIIEE